MQEYIKEQLELIEFTEYNLSNAKYKDTYLFHKNMLKMLNSELKLLQIAHKLVNFRAKLLNYYR